MWREGEEEEEGGRKGGERTCRIVSVMISLTEGTAVTTSFASDSETHNYH